MPDSPTSLRRFPHRTLSAADRRRTQARSIRTQNGFPADVPGIATVTPMWLKLSRKLRLGNKRWPQITLHMTLVVLVSAVVFGQATYPLLFVISLVLLLLSWRLGLGGTALGLCVVAMIGGWLTTHGHGPMALARVGTAYARDNLMQIFIASFVVIRYTAEIVARDRHRAEHLLQRAYARFNLLAEGSQDLIILHDMSETIEYVSPSVTRLLGWSPAEFKHLRAEDTVFAEDLPMVRERLATCLDQDRISGLHFRMNTKSGGTVWMESNATMHRAPGSGEPTGFISILREITVRKQTEERLTSALDEAENLAVLDALTGVGNRRSFDEALDDAWKRGLRRQTSLSVLLIDADHFKKYNDLYGHVAGDSCLRAIAKGLHVGIAGTGGHLSRCGGEEFAVILPHTPGPLAEALARDLVRRIDALSLAHRGNAGGHVTVSIGCATIVPQTRFLPAALIEAADAALYQAKHEGRNRMCTAPLDNFGAAAA